MPRKPQYLTGLPQSMSREHMRKSDTSKGEEMEGRVLEASNMTDECMIHGNVILLKQLRLTEIK
jgi:hypothetical protein